MTAPEDVWQSNRLPIWTFDVVTPKQRTGLPAVKVWRILLRASGLPFTPRSVGLWLSEYLSGAFKLGEPLRELKDQDPKRWRQHVSVWRGFATIAQDCGASHRTVRRAVLDLEDAGWLHVRRTDEDSGRSLRAMNRPYVLTITVPLQDPRPPDTESGGEGTDEANHRTESPEDHRTESPGRQDRESGGSGQPPDRESHELSSGLSLQDLPSREITSAEQGRRIAQRVKAGALSEKEGKEAVNLIPGVGPQAEFTNAYEDELRVEVVS